MMQLVVVDTTQIQSYVFGSNRLRENIGASHLVYEATEVWTIEAVREVAPLNNIRDDDTLDATMHIEDHTSQLDAEVIYAGGGNFVVLFRQEPLARKFTQRMSRWVLQKAPNLRLVIAQVPFVWEEDSFKKKLDDAFTDLAKQKRARRVTTPLLGLGVTVMCQSTALPTVDIASVQDETYPASAEIMAKLDAYESANERLMEEFGDVIGESYTFPRQLDELGRERGEQSHIAVVHADGNGIGKRMKALGMKALGQNYSHPDQNRKCISKIRSFSDAVKESSRKALKGTLNLLMERLQRDGGEHSKQIIHHNVAGDVIARVDLKWSEEALYLPFRPLVFGGDDLTFVSDGRLGLALAIDYLKRFKVHTQKLPDNDGSATACAGITIVKSHYPFARAYALAEELCKNAKKVRHESSLGDSWFDWHFALSGLLGSLDAIREREYKVKAGWLTPRPVTLEEDPVEDHRRWEIVRKGIAAFQDTPPFAQPGDEPKWSTRHNKVKALREALRGGPSTVEWFLHKYRLGTRKDQVPSLPTVCKDVDEVQKTGWWTDHCMYFDAIELADWFIPLEEESS